MSRYYSYINSAIEILDRYRGEEPFSNFLKQYFSANKKFGSKDRKQVAHLCYCYFRLGKAAMSLTIEERLLTGLFLCSDRSNEILRALKPKLDESVQLPLYEKLSIINYSSLISDVFPWKNELSNGIDDEKFCESFLIQPDVFLRLRPGHESEVRRKLHKAAIEFREINEHCLALVAATKMDDVIVLDHEAVVQDLNSQETGRFINDAVTSPRNNKPAVWDCCAGSGGKSIMAYDHNSKIELTVSDVRESILVNLKKRFQRAGIRHYRSFILDLVGDKPKISNLKSGIIICDAPCTGSGTWSRTPEQLYFFDEKQIESYSSLQKKIVLNVIPQLQDHGSFIYITCSVFKKENEELVEFIKENSNLQVRKMEVLKGYDKKADSMFVAVLGR